MDRQEKSALFCACTDQMKKEKKLPPDGHQWHPESSPYPLQSTKPLPPSVRATPLPSAKAKEIQFYAPSPSICQFLLIFSSRKAYPYSREAQV